MTIIRAFQQIAFVDTDTGEAAERRLTHREEAEQFYRALQARRVRIGMEASGHGRWFERLLNELQFELWIGDAAETRTKRVRKQKTDRQDAQLLLLKLLMEDRFPRIWVPDAEIGIGWCALMQFQEVQSVSGEIEGEDSGGLGPTFNGNGCAMCHKQPAIGGTSPSLNPQVALAKLHHASNTVPSFVTAQGPIREARFVRNRDGSPDGGVHGLFSIAGRDDAPGCNLMQPDFARQLAFNNVVFRIPTPLFGLGLVENTPDAVLRANLAATRDARYRLGIGGRFNTSGNDGTITRFGWKAQNKSLLIFAGEAYNVEQGVTNEVFPDERAGVDGCVFNPLPEDANGVSNEERESPFSDTVNFAIFMRLAAPPTPGPETELYP